MLHPLPALVWPLTDEPTLAAVAARIGDWPGLIEQAKHEGLLGLLAARLCAARPSGVPPEVTTELEHWRTISAQRGLRMAGQLVRIVHLLESSGIEVILLKGPSLAQDLYGDASVRTSCDLDILVRPDDAAAARQLLLANAFDDSCPYNERLLRRGSRSEGEVHLQRSHGELHVDLHWRLTVGFSTREVSAERLFAGARTADLLSRPVRVPSLGDQLLLTALHASRHDWRPLELRLGVAVQVARLPAAAWPDLCAAARELGCLRRVAVGVAHACRPFGVPVPSAILAELGRDPLASAYLGYLCGIAATSLAQPEAVPSVAADLASILWSVRAEDHLVGTLDHLLTRSFLPGTGDWATVRLPRRLEWLYWALRPVRLAAKYATRSLGHGVKRSHA